MIQGMPSQSCGVTLLLVLSPKLRVGLVTGARWTLQSMETKQVYLWLLHIIEDDVERKLEENEWIVIRVGNFSVEEVSAGKHPALETENFCGEVQTFREVFWWDKVRR